MFKKSKFLKLGWLDLLKGFGVTVVSSILSGVYIAVNAVPPHLPVGGELQTLALVGLSAGVSYLIKNFFENSEGKFLIKESQPNPQP